MRLLKLIYDANNSMTLDRLVDDTQRIIDLKTDNCMIEHQSKQVFAMAKSAKKHNIHKPSTKTPKSPCWLCGELHFVKFCKFKEHKCSSCHKIGHRDNYCSSAKNGYKPKLHENNNNKIVKKQYHTPKSNYHTNAVFSTKCLRFQELRKYVDLTINNQPVRLQIDIASDISIISTKTWKAIGKPEAFATHDGANDVNSNKINLQAKFSCNVSIGDLTKKVQCYVTNISGLNVMGIDWISSFQLWDQPISAWCRQIKLENYISELQTKYSTLFDNSSLGLCTKTKVHIHLLPNSKEIFIPKRPVLYAVRTEVEAEHQHLEEAEIITPIDTSK